MQTDESLQRSTAIPQRRHYDERMETIRAAFNANLHRLNSGAVAVKARAVLVDEVAQALWAGMAAGGAFSDSGIAIVAVGGYGRRELFPSSDVDLMFLLEPQVSERAVKEPIRRFSQALWDAGLRVSPMTRTLAECGRFDPENVEFTLSLLDARHVAGDAALGAQLIEKTVPKLVAHDRKKCIARLLEVTARRHTRYGDTLFHLEPNLKECPGGLRDVHVCDWLTRLGEESSAEVPEEFVEAREFLLLVRAFLHFRHGRDDNTLDWQAQDQAAAAGLGASGLGAGRGSVDAAFWMRMYFRHARAVERRTAQCEEEFSPPRPDPPLPSLSGLRRVLHTPAKPPPNPPPKAGFDIRNSRISLAPQSSGRATDDPAHDPDVVLAIFTAIARTGARLPRATEARLEDALPILSTHLEDGPALWHHLRAILTGPYAGRALRSMHAPGILELVIPEFHGIDALVIRDAYHRYTVDEHTFVVIDTLHALSAQTAGQDVWAPRFATILRDLPHPELLYLAALLHDTGKGHATAGHAHESARMAQNVMARLEIDAYEAGLVLDIIRNHLEMSAALRRDVFDHETIRSFATRVATPEALRMLTLFTYADIAAVHPDALTPWKAENLWRLYLATSNFLDRSVDDERVASVAAGELREVMHRVHALIPNRRDEVAGFLEGLPRRYLLTRTPDQIRAHIDMAGRLSAGEPNQVELRYAPGLSEMTLITQDRPMLFAAMAGALAAWGMNIVTADAFSNGHGLVVDSFRFLDTFRTLELNESERGRFVESVRSVMSGQASLEAMLASRRRSRRIAPKVVVETRIDFDDSASTQSTLLQVVAQDTPGLLHALAFTLAGRACNIEVALVDTEGEMAIDVFYVTQAGAKLEAAQQESLRQLLLKAISANAG
jgi:[protein-PII] uridylyltransferase